MGLKTTDGQTEVTSNFHRKLNRFFERIESLKSKNTSKNSKRGKRSKQKGIKKPRSYWNL